MSHVSHRGSYNIDRMVQEVEETASRDRVRTLPSREPSVDHDTDITFRPGIVHLLKNKFTQLSSSGCGVNSSVPVSCTSSPAIPRRFGKPEHLSASASSSPAINRRPRDLKKLDLLPSKFQSSSELPTVSQSTLRKNRNFTTSELNLTLTSPGSSSISGSWETSIKSCGDENKKFPPDSLSFPQEQYSLRNSSSETFLNRIGTFESRSIELNELPIKNIVASTRNLFENISSGSVSLPRPNYKNEPRKTEILHNYSTLPTPATSAKPPIVRRTSFTSSSSIQLFKHQSGIKTSNRTVQVIPSQSNFVNQPDTPERNDLVTHSNGDNRSSVGRFFSPQVPRKTPATVVEVRPYTPEIVSSDAKTADSIADYKNVFEKQSISSSHDFLPLKTKSFVDEARRVVHKSEEPTGRSKSWIFTTDSNFKNIGSSIPIVVGSVLVNPNSPTKSGFGSMSTEMAAQRTFWDSYREDKPDAAIATPDADVISEARRLVAKGTREAAEADFSENVSVGGDSFGEADDLSDEDDDTLNETEDVYKLKSCLKNPLNIKSQKNRLQFLPPQRLVSVHTYPSEASLLLDQMPHSPRPPGVEEDLIDCFSPPPPSDMDTDSLEGYSSPDFGSSDEEEFEDSLSTDTRGKAKSVSSPSKRTLRQSTNTDFNWGSKRSSVPTAAAQSPSVPRRPNWIAHSTEFAAAAARNRGEAFAPPVSNGNDLGVYTGDGHSFSSSMCEEADLLF